MSNVKPKKRPLAPLKSPRPPSREEGLAAVEEYQREREAQRRMQEQVGDVEFRASLDPHFVNEPVARLGFDPESGKFVPVMGNQAAYWPESNTGKDAQIQAYEQSRGNPRYADIKVGDVVIGPDTGRPAVWAHEYRHKGIDKLRNFYNSDPEFFRMQFGDAAADLLERMSKDYRTEEHFVEMHDHFEAPALGSMGTDPETGQPAYTMKPMLETIDMPASMSPQDRLDAQTRQAMRNARYQEVAFDKPEDRGRIDRKKYEAQLGLQAAAKYLLEQQGEPPRAEPDYPNWFERLTGLRFNEGGLVPEEEEEPRFETLTLPMGARGPEYDTPVGKDELGRQQYRTAGGRVYSVDTVQQGRQFETEAGSRERVGEVLKGYLDDLVGSFTSGVTAPVRALRGEPVTQGEALETAGMAATGAVGMPVPEGSLRAFGGKVQPQNPKFTPAFKSDWKNGVGGQETYIAAFYSPLEEAIRNVPVSAKGTKGENIMAWIEKKTPNLNRSEMEYLGFKLDPNKLYTRGELLEELALLERNVGFLVKVDKASMLKGGITTPLLFYKRYQRQNVADPEVDYGELKIEGGAVAYATHFSPNTIAHSRFSIRQPEEGKPYMLIEELQSDVVQNIDKDAPKKLAKLGSDFKKKMADDIEFVFYVKPDEDPEIANFLNQAEFYALNGESRNVSRITDKMADYLNDKYGWVGTEIYGNDLAAHFNRDEAATLKKAITNPSDAPITKTSQYVDQLLRSLIVEAKRNGIDEIALPSVEALAAARGVSAEKGSAFYQTYVDSFDKAVNALRREVGDKVKVGYREVPSDMVYSGIDKRKVIDITDLDIDPSNVRLRFAEGGMVPDNTENEMQNLLREGGIATDGMSRDPVSGNEVPPGSLAEEVRDDVPAQLSEGEYVVPADVVRYFGVNFFEQLRAKAKEGLGQMEQDGRIGGDPVPAEGGDMTEEALPFDISELQVRDEPVQMAAGGVVPPAQMNAASTNPAQQMSQFNPANYYAGFSLYDGKPGAPQAAPPTPVNAVPVGSTVVYVNSSGQQIAIQFDANGNPITPIPQGFFPMGQQQPEPVREGRTQEERDAKEGLSSEGGDGGRGYPSIIDKVDYSSPESVTKAVKDLVEKGSTYGRLGQGLGFGAAGPIGGIVGGTAPVANQVAKARAVLGVAEQKYNLDVSAAQDFLDDYVDGLNIGTRAVVNTFATGQRWTKNALEAAPATTTQQTPGATTTGLATPPARATQAPPARPKGGFDRGAVDRDAKETREQTRQRSENIREGREEARGAREAGRTARDIRSEGYSGRGYTGGRATGGLVSRKSTGKKKKS